MKINLINFMMLNYILQLSIVLIVALMKGWQNVCWQKGDIMVDKQNWKVILTNLIFALYCLTVGIDIQLVHSQFNRRGKIKLQVTSEIDNDYMG